MNRLEQVVIQDKKTCRFLKDMGEGTFTWVDKAENATRFFD